MFGNKHVIPIILSFAISFQAWASAPVIVTLASEDKQNAPWELGNGENIDWEKPGLSFEILRLVDEKLTEIEFRYQRIPWARCLLHMEVNKVDGVFTASFKTERMKAGVYPMKNGQADMDRRIIDL